MRVERGTAFEPAASYGVGNRLDGGDRLHLSSQKLVISNYKK